ncbi:hypothetical protein HT031_000047 [Scenedesmus sp. PABB004]|nr:hypothetical protein HT031_000047 [Scenedesmus sp. PABB004]
MAPKAAAKKAEPEEKEPGQCVALTLKGHRCTNVTTRTVKGAHRCHAHRAYSKYPAFDEPAIRCADPPEAPSVHWLPFGIGHEGPAAVGTYWAVEPEASGDGSGAAVCTAHFRGRRLKAAGGLPRPGAAPRGRRGGADTEQRSWQAVQQFRGLTLWNHDAPPAPSDWHARCIDWLALAEQVHAPVTLEAVEAELASMQQQQQQQGGGGS